MTNTSTQRTTALPLAPGTYDVDLAHSGVHFRIRHLGISNVRGLFKAFDATLTVGDTLADTAVRATIDLASIDTAQPDRDAHLLSTDFFDASQHPTMSFASTGVVAVDEDMYKVDGDLTIRGVTQSVTLDVELNGTTVFPNDGQPHTGFTATAQIRRADFGIDFNAPLGVDKLALGEKVQVELDLQFVPR